MLHLLSPDPTVPVRALHAPGGFAWWYADALDADHTGFVLIGSWGLPFLPGYASADRRDKAPPALARPSLNLAFYEKGVPVLYLLQEYPEQRASCGTTHWRFGESTLRLESGALQLDLNVRLPGSTERLRGSLRLEGPRMRQVNGEVDKSDASHGWTPVLGPCQAYADLRHGTRRFAFAGPGYADRNEGTLALHRLGLDHWVWARGTFGDETRVAYVLWPHQGDPLAYGVQIGSDGRAEVHRAEVSTTPMRRSLWGPRPYAQLDLTVDGQPFLALRNEVPVDDSPFYARTLGHMIHPDGRRAPAISERCHPDAIDPDWFRPFLRMACQHTNERGSAWQPLFLGPRDGRWSRLWRHWSGT